MKLAFAIYTLSPWSGLAKDCARIAQAAIDRGHKVSVFVTRVEGEGTALLPKAATVHQLPAQGLSNHARMKHFGSKSLDRIHAGEFDASLSFNRLPGYMYYYCADASFVLNAESRHSLLYKLTPRYRHSAKLERAVFSLSSTSTIFFVSAAIHQQYRQAYALADARSVVLPPFLNPDRSAALADLPDTAVARKLLQLPTDSLVILSVGSGFKTKGVDRSIRAIAALPSSLRTRVIFIVVGSGNKRPLIQLAREQGLSASAEKDLQAEIRLVGPSDKVALYMKAADLLLHPARNEASGTVLVEAMQSELAILCSGVCGYAPLVSEFNAGAVLSEPFVQSELDQTLAVTLQNPGNLKLGQNGAKQMVEVESVSMPEIVLNKIQELKLAQISDCYLSDELQVQLPKVANFDAVMRLEGQTYRRVLGRHTFRVEGRQKNYFVKIHTGVGWREIFKNILTLKLPVLGAQAEWQGAHRLRSLGIDTLEAVGFGRKGVNPAAQKSFFISNELPPATSLEALPAMVDYSPLSNKRTMHERRILIRRVANVVGRMHRSGANHRDLYLCHFWLEDDTNSMDIKRLYLIDLHRMQFRRQVPFRWLVKDLGGLYFSAAACGLSRTDFCRFISEYSGQSFREAITGNYKLWRSVIRRANRMISAGKQG